ncbi:MAG: diaminopimelate decarboxylase, partial [Gammaproteobacteria bacterium]|nr:diaminopimelate decarboxylase [Gammaproteobacteria bacterium]
TPTFVYNARRVTENIRRIHNALDDAELDDQYRIYYAMKANRFPPLLTHIKKSGLAGIDACSPSEVEHAISCGFRAENVSFTATSLSPRDFERLSRIKGLTINCDSLHSIRRWGEMGSGRNIGIRVNPAMGVGRAQNDKLQYCGCNTTKFGIYKEQFNEAIELAKQFDLTINRIHFHTGCGYLTPQLKIWDEIIKECFWFVDQLDTVEYVNVGGGLGVPHIESDSPLDLHQWAQILAKHFRPRKIKLEVEPGDYIVKDAGILLLNVNMIEQKKDTCFVGLDAGFNIALEPAVYNLPFQPVPVIQRKGEASKVTLIGNINEALDVWYSDIDLPPMQENDTLALINAGAYSSSMASNHCMRGEFSEFLL